MIFVVIQFLSVKFLAKWFLLLPGSRPKNSCNFKRPIFVLIRYCLPIWSGFLFFCKM